MSGSEASRDGWSDEDFIRAYGDEAKRRPWPYYLGAIQRPKWSGKIKTYLIWCPRCQYSSNRGFTVAHLAGYQGRLECSSCKSRFDHLLPARRLKGALLNPFSSPRLLMLLILTGLLIALAASR